MKGSLTKSCVEFHLNLACLCKYKYTWCS